MGFSSEAAQAAGTGIKAYSQIQAGNTKASLDTQNAAIADQQAKSEVNSGNVNANLMRQKGAQVTGQQISAIGANNLQQAGTPSQVVAGTAGATELNVLNTQNNALRRAWGFQVQGASDREQASLAKQGGMLSGIGSLASGGASLYNKWDQANPNRNMGGTDFGTNSASGWDDT